MIVLKFDITLARYDIKLLKVIDRFFCVIFAWLALLINLFVLSIYCAMILTIKRSQLCKRQRRSVN